MGESHRRTARRASFVLAVAGISILANFGLELAATRFPQLGLQRITAYSHKGGAS